MLKRLRSSGVRKSGDREGSSRPNSRFDNQSPSRSRLQRQDDDSAITLAVKANHTSLNKENRRPDQRQESPILSSKKPKSLMRSIYKRHPDAVVVEWSGDEDLPSKSTTTSRKRLSAEVDTGVEHLPSRNNKRKALSSPDFQRDDDESSSDPGFQNDQRNPKSRPAGRPIKRARLGNSNDRHGSGSELPAFIDPDDDNDDIQNQIKERSQLQAPRRSRSASREHSSVVVGGDEDSLQLVDDDLDDLPFSRTQGIARSNTRAQLSAKGTHRPQTREPWSERDTRLLVKLIKIYGAKWELIAKEGGFSRDKARDTDMRDRARNMKVDMIM